MNELLALDREFFLKIHLGLSNGFFDFLMPILRKPTTWIPLYAFIIYYSIKTYKKRGVYLVLMIVVTFGIGDFTSASVIKKAVGRVRPCNEVTLASQIIHRVPCGSGHSFPSAHATNHFAIAIFLIGAFYQRWRGVLPWALAWAAAISFAQVYVGVHYPVDVFCGAILGCLIGWLTVFIYRKTADRF